MLVCTIITLLGLICLVLYVREKLTVYSIKALLLKTGVSCLFLALALCALYRNPSKFGFFILSGLICGTLGDVWLDLKYIYPKEDTVYTYAGFISFALGHILFQAGMLQEFGHMTSGAVLLAAGAAALVLGILTVLAGPRLKLDYGKFKGISMLYGPLLYATMLFSLCLAAGAGAANRGLNLLFAGGVLFALSDLVLCGTYFGKDRHRPVDIILNYTFYYGAQFAIAWCVLFV